MLGFESYANRKNRIEENLDKKIFEKNLLIPQMLSLIIYYMHIYAARYPGTKFDVESY